MDEFSLFTARRRTLRRLTTIVGALAFVLIPMTGQTAPLLCADESSCLTLCTETCGIFGFALTGKVVIGTAGNDNLAGGPLNDCIVGNGGNDHITGNQGNDCIITGTGDDTVAGGSGDDVLLDLGGNNRLLGEVGNDVIISAASCFFEPLDNVSECVPSGDDTITGGSGDDAILDFGGNNRMTGEAGEDFIGVAASDSVNHSLVVGGSGDDLIDTEGGNNMLQGEAGNDLLEADDTLSNLDGGTGVDSCAGGARQIRCNP